MSVAEIPEVLGVVVEMPGGAGEDFAGRKLQENGIDDAVLVVLGLIGQARDKAVNHEGDEEVLLINIVDGEHGAAVEQELAGKGLEPQLFERDTQGRVGPISKDRGGRE